MTDYDLDMEVLAAVSGTPLPERFSTANSESSDDLLDAGGGADFERDDGLDDDDGDGNRPRDVDEEDDEDDEGDGDDAGDGVDDEDDEDDEDDNEDDNDDDDGAGHAHTDEKDLDFHEEAEIVEDEDDDEDDEEEDDDNDENYRSKFGKKRRHPDDPGIADYDDDPDEDDDDDDDYNIGKSTSKTKPKQKGQSRGSVKNMSGTSKRPSSKISPADRKKKKAKPLRRPSKSKRDGNAASNEVVDDDDVFTHEFDERGYGDAADREKVMNLNEIERETLLAERVEERQKAERLWHMTRQVNRSASTKRTQRVSSRSKSSKTENALETLKADKIAKRIAAQKRPIDGMSDDASEDDGNAKRRRMVDQPGAEKVGVTEEVNSSEVEMSYSELVVTRDGPGGYTRELLPTHLFIPRDKLFELAVEPYFSRAVIGLFVRPRGFGDSSYVLCRIKGVKEKEKIYNYTDRNGAMKRCNLYLTVAIGPQTRDDVSIEVCSNSVPTSDEFRLYKDRLVELGTRIISKAEAADLLQHAKAMTGTRKSVQATEDELKAHHANQEFLYPENVNWTMRKTEVLMLLTHYREQLKSAQGREDHDLAEETKLKIAEYEQQLEKIEARQGPSQNSTGRRLDVFQSVARKNNEINLTNERLAKSRRALETTVGGVDPFARFDTTGMSYFSISKPKQALKSDAIGSHGTSGSATATIVSGGEKDRLPPSVPKQPIRGGPDDWKLTLRTRHQGLSSSRAISGRPLSAVYGIEFEGLDDFKRSPDELRQLFSTGLVFPPSIDAIYMNISRSSIDAAPSGGKAITLEEYNRLRSE